MPILPPAIDDRSFEDLRDELISRIAAHTPEWTHPQLGDPGYTLVELFAWLTDTLLYRANLIPERQRLVFLRLLGMPLQPAVPAQGLIQVAIANPQITEEIVLQSRATVPGPVTFETRSELTVLPMTAEAYCKRRLTDQEATKMTELISTLQVVYQDLLDGQSPQPYVTTPVFANGLPDRAGFTFDLQTVVDGTLWLALLAPDPKQVESVRQTLGSQEHDRQRLLNIGILPAMTLPDPLTADIGPRAQIPHVWEISTGQIVGTSGPRYLPLQEYLDTTAGLTQPGIVRLVLPAVDAIGVFHPNQARTELAVGLGPYPPRIDHPATAERVVAWLRLRPTAPLTSLSLSWVGVNAIAIDQQQTIRGRVIGQSNGAADQEFALPGQAVDPDTLQIQVEEPDRGYQAWQAAEDLALISPNGAAFQLDREAGIIRFGDGMRGRIPAIGSRIRVAEMQFGGGSQGNVPGGTLQDIQGRDLRGRAIATPLRVEQSLATWGGKDAETFAEAERRIPALLRHRDRAVTADDYRQLVLRMPRMRGGRVEILPRFKPHQRQENVPGVVAVMVLPFKAGNRPPNPRPDRPLLESVHADLDERRPLSTELYIIGCEYIPLSVSVGVEIADGFGRDQVLSDVQDTLFQFLHPLWGGREQQGWPRSTPVKGRELEVMVARVPGVEGVLGLHLFERQIVPLPASQPAQWQMAGAIGSGMARAANPSTTSASQNGHSSGRVLQTWVKRASRELRPWQLPELLSIVAVADELPPAAVSTAVVDNTAPTDVPPYTDLPESVSTAPAQTGAGGVAVPVVPEVC